MRYDLDARAQLPDLLQLDKDDPRGTYGPAVLRDGRVLMATGNGGGHALPATASRCATTNSAARAAGRV